MKLAFCLFKYFPFGGMQRDFFRIAKACEEHGHEIHVFTMDWQGDRPPSWQITLVPAKGWSNHRRAVNFSHWIARQQLKEHFDVVIGFNRIPRLDIYFAADSCYAAVTEESHGFLYKMTPRYRTLIALERAVFSPVSKTCIFVLSQAQQADFMRYYRTQRERFFFLPPGIDATSFSKDEAKVIRENYRARMRIKDTEHLVLMVGSHYQTKGVDRAIFAFAALPAEVRMQSHLVIIGVGDVTSLQRLAKRLCVQEQVHFLGGRDDVNQWMLAADVLIHPSRREAAGMVLLEALVAGLPVLVTANCGYAFHIARAKAGIVVPMPFQQAALNEGLKTLLTTDINLFRQNALDYAVAADLYRLPEQATSLIEKVALNDNAHS